MNWPRIIHQLYADVTGKFWMLCPICGEMFGGHESASQPFWDEKHEHGRLVCKACGPRAASWWKKRPYRKPPAPYGHMSEDASYWDYIPLVLLAMLFLCITGYWITLAIRLITT